VGKSWSLPTYLFTACILLVSCVPNAVTYYQPSMVGGTVKTGRCVPTKSVVQFTFWQPGAHPLHGTAYISSHGDKTTFFLNLSPFYSQTIAFTDERFRIVDSASHKDIEIVSTSVYRDDGGTSLKQAYPIRKPGKPARRVGAIFVGVSIARTHVRAMDVFIPRIVLDGKKATLPPIHFRRTTWMGISPFNC
jgi:hypothetical protein